jgi:acetylornithine deacetylase/succinyl-diaminopimelate desuccinylase-like protein
MHGLDAIDREWMTHLLRRALAYPSPQTADLEADPRMAAFIRDVVIPEAEALGPDRLHVDRMGNVLAQWGHGIPALALAIYAMTHPQTTMADAFTPTIVDGGAHGVAGSVMRGRGACEQKGAMAAALAGLRAALGAGAARRAPLALVALTSGETGRPDAIRHLLEETGARFDLLIVACGTGNRICLAQKGRLDVDIVVRGRQSHSSMPWQGLNALEGAATVLTRLAAHKTLGEHPRLGPITLTPTALETAPRATHTVPAVARITVDRRLAPGDEPEGALAELRAFVGDLAPFEVAYQAGPYMYAYELSAEDRLPRLLREGFARAVGRPAEYMYASGGLDAGYLNRHGTESLMFGPGDLTLAHTADDVVSLADCAEAAAVYADAALTVGGRA